MRRTLINIMVLLEIVNGLDVSKNVHGMFITFYELVLYPHMIGNIFNYNHARQALSSKDISVAKFPESLHAV